MKKIILGLLGAMSFNAFSADWFDDWEINYIPVTENRNVFQGHASCFAPGVPIPLQVKVAPTVYSTVYIYLDYLYGIAYQYDTRLIPRGANYCAAAVPFSFVGAFTTGYSKEIVPILPYPQSVDTERLACTSISQRRIIFRLSGPNSYTANSMKIYGSSSPYHPDTLYYSGPFNESKILTVNATSNIMNFRVKVDNGSSYYLSANNMNCTTGGGGGPLN